MPRPILAILAILLAIAATACGGSTTTDSPGTHPRDAGGTPDAHTLGVPDGPTSRPDARTLGVPDGPSPHADSATGAPWSPVCPESAPTEGASCHLDDVSCEYGCGNILVCAGGSWGGEVGFDTPSCDAGANPTGCPAVPAQIVTGAGCTVGGSGACTYATGACACTFPFDPIPDASSTWYCYPEGGCPWPRPRVGSACTIPDLHCDYAACGSTEECTGGVWQASQGGCGG